MHNLLVTGAAGFIGANFCHYWLRENPEANVLAFDALTYAGNQANLDGLENKPGFSFVRGDIGDQKLVAELLHKQSIDTIVHFAAESHVDRSIDGPDSFIQTNIVGTHNLLQAAKQVWLDQEEVVPHRFHHVSTDEVYGDLDFDDPAFEETTAYAPNSPYSASKAASDHLVRAYHHTYGLEVTTSNCSNNYGPYQFPEKLVALMITNILQGEALPIYGDGSNVRDWLYVEDHCRGIARVLADGKIGETYNIGGDEEHSNLELVAIICAVLDDMFEQDPSLSKRFPNAPPANNSQSDSLISFVTDRLGHDRRYAINPTKIRDHLSFRPEESFTSGLQKTVAWYLQNEAWWRAVMRGEHRHWLERQYGRTAS